MHRPKTVTVFGVLNLGYGCLSLCGVAFNASTVLGLLRGGAESPIWDHPLGRFQMIASTLLSVPATIAVFAAGIGLLMMKSWGRVLSAIYAIFSIVSTTLGLLIVGYLLIRLTDIAIGFDSPEAIGGVIGLSCGFAFSLLYPALLWFYMTRPWIVAAFDAEQPAPDWSYTPPGGAGVSTSFGAASSNPFAAPQTLTGAAPLAASTAPSATIVDALIPARNGPALASYYLGLFSLFPVLGLPLAIAALVLGIKGLARARENPEVRGRVHAWVGIICGSIFGLFNLLIVLLVAVGLGMALVG